MTEVYTARLGSAGDGSMTVMFHLASFFETLQNYNVCHSWLSIDVFRDFRQKNSAWAE
jgi:hypothetical protein